MQNYKNTLIPPDTQGKQLRQTTRQTMETKTQDKLVWGEIIDRYVIVKR